MNRRRQYDIAAPSTNIDSRRKLAALVAVSLAVLNGVQQVRPAAASDGSQSIFVGACEFASAAVGVLIAVDVDGQKVATAAMKSDIGVRPSVPEFSNLPHI